MLRFFAKRAAEEPVRSLAPGKMAFAIGDIHGRLDLLETMLCRLEREAAARDPAATFLVLLGDLVDRGPDSRGVVDRLQARPPAWARLVLLMGNHEEAMLAALDGDFNALRDWLRFGGFECAESYGIMPDEIAALDPAALLARLRAAIPADHLNFLREAYDSFQLGPYLFVHAGLRPGVEIGRQRPEDMRWIRADFLEDQSDHGVMVVHGHTIVEAPERHPNRIALDTGAYRTGRLSALRLEGSSADFITVEAAPPSRLPDVPG